MPSDASVSHNSKFEHALHCLGDRLHAAELKADVDVQSCGTEMWESVQPPGSGQAPAAGPLRTCLRGARGNVGVSVASTSGFTRTATLATLPIPSATASSAVSSTRQLYMEGMHALPAGPRPSRGAFCLPRQTRTCRRESPSPGQIDLASRHHVCPCAPARQQASDSRVPVSLQRVADSDFGGDPRHSVCQAIILRPQNGPAVDVQRSAELLRKFRHRNVFNVQHPGLVVKCIVHDTQSIGPSASTGK